MDVVTLLGPPGSGKSTVTEALTAQRADVRVFRLREFAHQQAGADRTVARALADSRDPLGWLPDAVAVLLVRRALERYVGDGGVLLLEGYPGTPYQAFALTTEMSQGGFGGGGIELTASDQVLRERIGQRFVCPGCDPQRRRPAVNHPGRPSSCAACGTELERRANDAPGIVAQRLARYRHRTPQTRAVFQDEGLAWRTVDAGQHKPAVLALALDAFSSLAPAPSDT